MAYDLYIFIFINRHRLSSPISAHCKVQSTTSPGDNRWLHDLESRTERLVYQLGSEGIDACTVPQSGVRNMVFVHGSSEMFSETEKKRRKKRKIEKKSLSPSAIPSNTFLTVIRHISKSMNP